MFVLNRLSPNLRQEHIDHDGGVPSDQPNNREVPSAGNGRTTYVVQNNNLTKRKHLALMDRGANGGLMGEEGRLIEWTDRTIDCTGIDSHEIRDLKIGSFGATVRTQMGPIIIEMHEYAYVHGGKTIHSCGQIEFNKNVVNDKSFAVTGETPHVKTLEGYMIPMKTVNGLPYIEMRPYTDDEWKELPHVRLTDPGEWDPAVLDSPIPTGWYERQDRTSEYMQDMPFDEFGVAKEGDMPQLQRLDSDEYSEEFTDEEPTSRRTVEVHLHQLVKNELVEDYQAFEVADGQWITVERPFIGSYEVNVVTRRPKKKTAASETSEPKARPGKDIRVGTVITKQFKEGIFKGTVTEVPTSKTGYYRVIYEDNDKEDFMRFELERLIRQMKDHDQHKTETTEKKKGDDCWFSYI